MEAASRRLESAFETAILDAKEAEERVPGTGTRTCQAAREDEGGRGSKIKEQICSRLPQGMQAASRQRLPAPSLMTSSSPARLIPTQQSLLQAI